MSAAIAPNSSTEPLSGVRVLVVEDDFFIGIELTAVLTDAGATVVGPSQDVRTALARLDDDGVSAAVLDVRLDSETVAPVARRLADQHVPFLFYTGQDRSDPIRKEWPGCRVLSKPAAAQALVQGVASLVGRPAGA